MKKCWTAYRSLPKRSSIALTGRFGGRGDRQMARGPKRRVPSAVLKPELERFYTTQDVADLFQTSRRTVQFWIREGKLKAVRIGREWRVEPAALREFTERGRVGG